jgi:hypothetical protein
MGIHVEWANVRDLEITFGGFEDTQGNKTNSALVLASDSVFVIEGRQDVLLEFLRNTIEIIEDAPAQWVIGKRYSLFPCYWSDKNGWVEDLYQADIFEKPERRKLPRDGAWLPVD